MYFVILAFIAIASLLVWYLLVHDHGRKLPVATLWYACGFGVMAMGLAMGLERLFLPSNFVIAPQEFPFVKQLGYFMSIGFIEETAKFLPLALFIYKRDYFREHTDGCIYFAICGLTFGLVENILYTVSYGTTVGLTRLLLTPFLHAASTSILGYYLVSWKLQSSHWKRFAVAAVLVPLMHGLYDLGMGADALSLQVLSLMLTLLFSMGLFLYFMEANELDRVMARRPVGFALQPISTGHEPNFCTTCGQANVYHRAYCEHCGRKL
ncbi:MAG TPA: PrsW family glutamic-type intramembrane protease [Candidatus Microsaccharimonas sp.]|nr:PrsW family glutamic-type intramembrane protease [Candidatus Microsaccharimonas sp.]